MGAPSIQCAAAVGPGWMAVLPLLALS